MMNSVPKEKIIKFHYQNTYYDAFQNILQDKNQELIILENFNKEIIGPSNLPLYHIYHTEVVLGLYRGSEDSQEI